MRHNNVTPHPHEPGSQPPPSRFGDALPPTVRDAMNEIDLGPLADREVPLPNNQTPALVEAWLDGEISATTVRASQGGEEAVDIWTRINNEAEVLRTRTTPLYVHKRIMDALPADVHQLSHPWYRRAVTLNPITLIVAAAALLGIGVAIARLMAH
jgi:hypothetical protein